MGQEIVYCFKCRTRLTSQDLERGKARRLGNRVACSGCVTEEEAGAAAPPAEEADPPRPSQKLRETPRRPSSSSAHAAVPSGTPRAFRSPTPSGSPWPWVGAAVAGVSILILLGMALSGGRRSAPTPVDAKTSETPAPAPPAKPDGRAKEAREALARARTLELSSPAELDAIVAAYEEAVRKADKTDFYTDAVRAYDAAVARRKEAAMKAELDLDRAIQEALAREDFGAARAAAEKRPGGAWAARIRDAAEARLEEVRAKAADARRRRDEAELAALRARVAGWGYPDLAAALEDPGGWRPLFDGRSLDAFLPATLSAWKLEGGALVPQTGPSAHVKIREEFGDVDLRIRFEFADAGNLCFWGRQGEEGRLGVEWNRPELDALRGAPRELILRLRGEGATAALDGAVVSASSQGRILKGMMQISVAGKGFRLLRVDVRPPRAETLGEWRAIFNGRTADCLSADSRKHWVVEGAALVTLPVKEGQFRDTLQTREKFGNGDLRIVFELIEPIEQITFSVRQADGGRVAATLAGGRLKSLGPGRHEILMSCRGRSVTATVDGTGQDVYGDKIPDAGHVQVSCRGNGMRIHAMEWREASP